MISWYTRNVSLPSRNRGLQTLALKAGQTRQKRKALDLIVVLMGVSGSGKTTIGKLLAQRISAQFADADDFHSAENKAKMASGTSLNDVDRQPWLQTLNQLLRKWAGDGIEGVLACSALKEQYRVTLKAGAPSALFHWVLLDGPKTLIAQRLSSRQHEYMNPSLLESQIDTLEPPLDGIRVMNDRVPSAVVDEIVQRIGI